jgi:hypothetical protein
MAVTAEWQGVNQEQATGRLHVQFSLKPVKDEAKSLEEGRPIYVEKEWIDIKIPGDKDNDVSREIRASDKEQYPLQWAAFVNKKEQPIEGTLLEQLPFLSKAQVLEFNGIGIRTAEQFRDMSDAIGMKIMGYHGIKKRIAVFLDAATGSATTQKLASELEKRDNEIAMLKTMVETLGAKVDEQNKGYAVHKGAAKV